jgi:hypothetical protein
MTEVRSGFSWYSLTAVALCIGIICWLALTATSKTDDTSYAGKATHNESTLTVAPVENNYPFAFPRCGQLFSVNGDMFKPIVTNSVKAKK